jgi:hypothetical protein
MAKKILLIGLMVGLLDALAASIHAYLASGIMPYRVFQYVASGLIGKNAYQTLALPVSLGLLIHFTIAITATFIFYQAYKRLGWSSTPKFLPGSIYGIGIWVVMNYIVVPLSLIGAFPKNPTPIIIGLLIHIFVIGIPIEMMIRKVFQKKSFR